MSSEPVYVYRGVHGKHPALAHAQKGQIVPGEIDGDLTPAEHNELDLAEASPFTSWTYSLPLATSFAKKYAPSRGVVLRCEFSPPSPGDSWSWADSPNVFHEREVLLRGIRINWRYSKHERQSRVA